jgi:hypothetical protein
VSDTRPSMGDVDGAVLVGVNSNAVYAVYGPRPSAMPERGLPSTNSPARSNRAGGRGAIDLRPIGDH